MAIAESDIRGWVGSTYAERGERYQRQGRVSELQRTPEGLRAACQGSQPSPYRVEVRLEGDEYVGSNCSCPVGVGCKHVAAVLYAYVRRDDEPPEVGELGERLGELPKDRLVELVERYAERHTDFASWLEVQLATSEGDAGDRIERSEIRQRVDEVLERAARGHRWGRPPEFDELEDLLDNGRTYLEEGDAANALAMVAPVARGLLDRYHHFDDSSGEILGPVFRAGRLLVEAFEAAEDAEVRSEILNDLWELWDWDVQFGGVLLDIPFDRAFFGHADEAEQRSIADRARERIDQEGPAEDDGLASNWALHSYAALFLDLEADHLSDDEIIEIVERTNFHEWWVRELVDRGELEEAAKVARELETMERLSLADAFLHAGARQVAMELLAGVADEDHRNHSRRARERLLDLYTDEEQWEEALEVALDAFEANPNRGNLQRVERLAGEVDRWEDLEADLLNELGERAPAQLIWYYLADDDPDAAVAIWEGTDLESRRFDRVRFAREIADSHPEVALELFELEAEKLIAARGRSNYRDACEYIDQMREIYEATDRREAWERRRARFEEEYSNLPAFQDEMGKRLNSEG